MVLQEAANEQKDDGAQMINYDVFDNVIDDDKVEPPVEECFTPTSSDPILNNSMPRFKTTSIQEKARKKPPGA